MRKKLFIVGLILILIFTFISMLKPKYYILKLNEIQKNNINEYNATGILTKSLYKNSLSFNIYNLYPKSNYFEIYVGDNENKELLLGFGRDGIINIIENNFSSNSVVKSILKNKDNIYLFFYIDDSKDTLSGIFKLVLEERN